MLNIVSNYRFAYSGPISIVKSLAAEDILWKFMKQELKNKNTVVSGY